MAKETAYSEIERKAYKTLSEIHEQMGDISSSFYYFKAYSDLNDSIFNEHKYSAVAELEVKYETEKKEQQLALYAEQAEVQRLRILQRNRMLLALAIAAFLLILIVYLLYQQYRVRSIQKALELEQKLLRSQMNPHFIFNSLIAIQSFIYSKDAFQAGDYLAKFAELVRHTLVSSRTELISLQKEIEMMRVYLDLQKLRFEEHFEYKLEVDDQLEVEDLYIPPMFAQPFIENAIEHGLRHRGPGGLVRIRYSMKEKDVLQIKVTDNGIGREASAELGEKSGHKSMGIAITEERLGVLSKKYNRKFTMQTRDLKDDEDSNAGFEVQIDVPVRKTPIQ
jgi:LytS/YehU family sensor histidine kinase